MIVVDTSAVIAILLVEPDAESFRRIVSDSAQLAIAAPTLVEAHIVAKSRLGTSSHQVVHAMISGAGIDVVPFDSTHIELAIEAYRRFGRGSGSPARLNFGDCFSYALARSLDAPLLFKGDDFFHTDIEPALVA
ncbi:hypothetical protein LCGC14_0339730 [marine sediment metagenome]|uniref:PIN domain-containing protein n=1 Tax=marine sediment metagenome TaxID=412755 RepID=A0A0F9TJR5_9ZZZZ